MADLVVLYVYASVAFLSAAIFFLGFHRIARELPSTSALAKPDAGPGPAVLQSQAEMRAERLLVAGWVALLYGFGVCFTMMNKWLLSDWHGTGFDHPCTTTSVQLLMMPIMSALWARTNRITIPQFERGLVLRNIAPVGIAVASEVVLDNVALSSSSIDVSFFSIVKSASLLWVLLWSVLFRLENPSWKMLGVILSTTIGLGLASYNDVSFDSTGFVAATAAAAVGGLRWCLIQRLFLELPECQNATTLIHYMAPWMAGTVTLSALCVDWIPAFLGVASPSILQSPFLRNGGLLFELLIGLTVAGLLSFFYLMAQVRTVQLTRALTAGLLSNLKDCLQIGVAALMFSDHITGLNVLGFLICVLAANAYRLLREHENTDSFVAFQPVPQADDAFPGQATKFSRADKPEEDHLAVAGAALRSSSSGGSESGLSAGVRPDGARPPVANGDSDRIALI